MPIMSAYTPKKALHVSSFSLRSPTPSSPTQHSPTPRSCTIEIGDLKWSSEDLELLVFKVLEAKKVGIDIEVGMQSAPWDTICAEIFSEHSAKYEQGCRQMWLHLKRQCNELKFFHNRPEFTWSHKNGQFIAEEEVWEAMEKDHPEKMRWCDESFPWFFEILSVIGDTTKSENLTPTSQPTFVDRLLGARKKEESNIRQKKMPKRPWKSDSKEPSPIAKKQKVIGNNKEEEENVWSDESLD